MSNSTQATPSVSVLIPVYNRETMIGVCIQSALDQTLSPYEVVVVDNASTDGTWAVCQEFAAKDERVRIFRNSTNIGPVRNWQRCINEARGDYGKILFSDDLMYPSFLEKTVPYLTDESVGFVFTGVHLGTSPSEIYASMFAWDNYPDITPSSQFIYTSLLDIAVPWSPGCALFRLADLKKNLIWDIPSPTISDFLMHGAGPDLLLYLLTARQYPYIAHVSQPLAFFHNHPKQISTEQGEKLIKPYQQARIWFADTYTNKWLVKLVLARTWLILLKVSRRWIWPRQFVSEYLPKFTWSWIAVIRMIMLRLQQRLGF